MADIININEVPYISTYYIEPTRNINEDIVIEYYVTDYNQKEYLSNDNSEKFIIEYWINGNKKVITEVLAGNNFLNVGKLAKGKYFFDIQATDKYNRKSHRLFNEFMVIENGVDDLVADEEIYKPLAKELLDKFKVYIDNTNPIDTTKGLNDLIKYASENGYRKIILPNGIYAIDENNTVLIDVSNITLDLNKSVFKTNPNKNESSLMFKLDGNIINSHVINGVLEGDLDKHDYSVSATSEFCNAVTINGADYSSFENLTIRKFVGYGTCTNFGNYDFRDEDGIASRRVAFWVPGGADRVLGDIKDGQFIASSNQISTTKFLPLKATFRPDSHDYNFQGLGFFCLGAYLGYQGNVTDNWVYKAHFYDVNKVFIETIEGYAYRKLRFSKDARFVKFTFLTKEQSVLTNGNIMIWALHNPINSSFKNIKLEDIRCVGSALCGFNNMLVDKMTFRHCGWALAKCAWDAEDGWDMMQDLTIRNSEFVPNTSNGNIYLNCAGHNFIAENNINFGSFQYERCRSFVYRNNIMNAASSEVRRDDMTRSGYFRSYGNTYNNSSLTAKVNRDNSNLVYKDEIINSGVYARSGGVNRKINLVNAKISKGNIGESDLIISSSTFDNYTGSQSGGTYNDCVFNGITTLSFLNLSSVNIFNNCTFNGVITIGRVPNVIFNNCILKSLVIASISATNNLDISKLVFNKCKITVKDNSNFIEVINSAQKVGMKFKDCTITQVGNKDLLYIQMVDIEAIFENCIINKTEGKLLSGYYASSYMTTKVINVQLIKTNIDSRVVLNKWADLNNVKVIKK